VRLNHAAVIVAIAGGMLWIEHRHQIVTDAPTSAELDARAAATACPDNENVPYGENCIVFMQGGAVSNRMNSAEPARAVLVDGPGPACPANNENKPYSANCIRFMSGWFWRPDSP